MKKFNIKYYYEVNATNNTFYFNNDNEALKYLQERQQIFNGVLHLYNCNGVEIKG